MTTALVVVDGDRGEGIDKAVRRRINEELGRVGLSVSEVARRMGTTQQKLSRRMTEKSWSVAELHDFCSFAGISYMYVTTGIKEIPTRGPGDDGGWSHPRESNSRPIHYRESNNPGNGELSTLGEVVPMWPRRVALPLAKPLPEAG